MNILLLRLIFATSLLSMAPAFSVTLPPAPATTTAPKPASKPAAPAPSKGKLIAPKSVDTSQSGHARMFAFPGVVTLKDGQWIGIDNFVNISKDISMRVDILKPEALKLNFTSVSLENGIGAILSKGGFRKKEEAPSEKPPLPFLHFKVMVYPVQAGYAAVIVASLFEEVRLDRVQLDRDFTFQAITWEQSKLLVAPTGDFEKEVQDGLDTITSDLIKRVAAYQVPHQQEPAS